jgi:hypothetical protein
MRTPARFPTPQRRTSAGRTSVSRTSVGPTFMERTREAYLIGANLGHATTGRTTPLAPRVAPFPRLGASASLGGRQGLRDECAYLFASPLDP